MADPVISRLKPYRVQLEPGRDYFWCSCGRSQSQPYCDGSHRGTHFSPLRFSVDEPRTGLLCGCKRCEHGPFCDGSHNNLSDEYAADERPLADLLAMTAEIDFSDAGRALLDGGCYVQRPDQLQWRDLGGLQLAPVITAEDGATHLSQWAARLELPSSPVLYCQGSETVIYLDQGSAEIELAEGRESLTARSGTYIRPGEHFRLHRTSSEPLYCLMCICPLGAELKTAGELCNYPDGPLASRSQGDDQSQRNAMADRYYQVLVGPDSGSQQVSQFIGQIPRSKAAPHRHLYEETIMILSGEGMLWTESKRAPVAPGDFIFLPAEQEHSLQCHSAAGMELVGHFYPAGSPSINY